MSEVEKLKTVFSPLIFLLFCCFFLVSFFAYGQNLRQTSFDDRLACEQARGTWRQFGNACADECEAKFDQFSICSREIIYSCECGKSRCFDGETCVLMSDYKKTFDEKKIAEQKLLNEAKEKRKDAAMQNRQQILMKFSSQSQQNGQTQSGSTGQQSFQQNNQPSQNPTSLDPALPQQNQPIENIEEKPSAPIEKLLTPGLPVVPLPN